MSFDFSTLITDRTNADVAAVKSLIGKIVAGTATDAEIATFNAAAMKGAYNYTDLNRVTAALEYLDETLRSYGYITGYQRIEIPHTEVSGSRLPDGYTEVGYIESSGTQYIDTGFKPNQDTRVVMDAELISQSNANAAFFGVRDTSAANAPLKFIAWSMGTGTTIRSDFFGASANPTATVSAVGNRIIVDKNKNICTFGSSVLTNTVATGQCTKNLYLLCCNDAGTANYLATAKLYSCQIYDNNTLVHDYIPCINPDGDVGLYDLETVSFLTNSGTGTFIAGPVPVVLPAGYTQVAYIQSSGTQYIDTGFKPNQDTRVVMDFEFLEIVNQYADPIFGVRTSASSNAYYFWSPGYATTTEQFQSGYNNSSTYPAVTRVGRHIVDKNKNVTTVDGVSTTATYAAFSTNWNMLLFNSYNNGSLYGNTTKMKLYSCQIYDNGTLIRNYVPCVNPSGATGLYDLLNNVFYGNAGTGAFTTGTVIDPPQTVSEEPAEDYDPYTWYESDVPTQGLMAAYLSNVLTVYNTILSDPELPETMEKLTYTGANQIEQAFLTLNTAIEHIVAGFARSNSFTFWSGNRPFPTAYSDRGRNWAELDAMETGWRNWQVADWYLLLYGNLQAEGDVT